MLQHKFEFSFIVFHLIFTALFKINKNVLIVFVNDNNPVPSVVFSVLLFIVAVLVAQKVHTVYLNMLLL